MEQLWEIVSTPDNIPIVLMLFLFPYFLLFFSPKILLKRFNFLFLLVVKP